MQTNNNTAVSRQSAAYEVYAGREIQRATHNNTKKASSQNDIVDISPQANRVAELVPRYNELTHLNGEPIQDTGCRWNILKSWH